MKNTRAAAARALVPVLLGKATLDECLRNAAEQTEPRERALLREFCFGVCRHYQELDGLLAPLLNTPLKPRDADVRALLLLGIYQMRCMRIPDHAAVAETVQAVQTLQKPWARGLVNAVLRAYQSRVAELETGLRPWQRVSHPAWLLETLTGMFPDDVDAIVAANNVPGPLTLRVNVKRTTREAWLARAAAAGVDARAGTLSPDAIVLATPMDVSGIPGFAEGEVSVQDEAAQLAARLLAPQPGERILDACAAPGGKACHLLERCSEIDLLALDVQASRLQRVQENLDRLALHATVREGDATTLIGWWDARPFDAVLVDAPCSGTGVLRRHPDIKVLRRPGQVLELVQNQMSILITAWSVLRGGGRLLYATCSVLPEENDILIGKFLRIFKDATAQPIGISGALRREHGVQLLPKVGGNDGFYYALLQKAPQ